ncbi:MAG: hypothetical protein H8J66_11265 [Nitrospira sp.]|nr:hypothetical protein [Nitrospira sp.]
MKSTIGRLFITLSLGSTTLLIPFSTSAAEPGEVRTRAEQSFDQLKQHQEPQGSAQSVGETHPLAERNHDTYSSDRYWVGKGHGDLTKGKIICQRVSELSARTDLAKQIRVMVKEHMVDRVRERTGREPEQDIELTREELVQEYLLGVKIIDRQIDEEHKICTATAVMLKSPLQPRQAPDLDPGPPASR